MRMNIGLSNPTSDPRKLKKGHCYVFRSRQKTAFLRLIQDLGLIIEERAFLISYVLR